jgi:hypothetical protein
VPILLHLIFVCTWAVARRPADLHMAQPNVPVSTVDRAYPAWAIDWSATDYSMKADVQLRARSGVPA